MFEGRLRFVFALLATSVLAGAATGSRAQPAEPTIDILVLYTATAKAELDRRGRDIKAEIGYAELAQNEIFANSGVAARVNLIAQAWPEFDEATHVPSELQCNPQTLNCVAENLQVLLLPKIVGATNTDDAYKIKAHRKAASADLVSLWMWRGGWDTTGSAATGLNRFNFNAGAAMASQNSFLSLVLVEKAWLYSHFAHEIGHNFGLADGGENPDYTFNEDAFGHTDGANGFRTIMAGDGRCLYQTCHRIPTYSNTDPQYTYFGHPIGAAGFNAAKTVNETVQFVSTYSDHLP